jgi:hypothetical protein
MMWLTPDEFQVYGPFTEQLQIITLGADVSRIVQAIPSTPEKVPELECPPGPTNRWYGLIGNRPIIIECVEDEFLAGNTIFVYTPFPNAVDGSDWTTIFDLHQLPSCIYSHWPEKIGSRFNNSKIVVRRSDPRGWSDAVYFAGSTKDAEDLIAYLNKDVTNGNCFIGQPDPAGKWIVSIKGTDAGVFTDRNSAFRHAIKTAIRIRSTDNYNEPIVTIRKSSPILLDEEYAVINEKIKPLREFAGCENL